MNLPDLFTAARRPHGMSPAGDVVEMAGHITLDLLPDADGTAA